MDLRHGPPLAQPPQKRPSWPTAHAGLVATKRPRVVASRWRRDLGSRMPAIELPVLAFSDADAFEGWLGDHWEDSSGARLSSAKQNSATSTMSKLDAIDCALAYGWVDGQLGRVDGHVFKARFTPKVPQERLVAGQP
jgi:hypothetical protein